MIRISFVYLLFYVPYMQKFFKNMHASNAAAGARLGYNDIFFPTIGTILEVSYVLLSSVMTLHYHRLYQI